MNSRRNGIVKILTIISIIVDLFVNFLMNKFSVDNFNFRAPHNICAIIIFVILVLILIICKITEYNYSVKTRNKKFQKVFRENGGFEVIVDEMKVCIKSRDYKSFSKLKRIAEDLER